MAYLVFSTRQGEEIGRRQLDGPMVIGRAPECDIALTDGALSRRHCRLAPSGNGWVLMDLASRNGTCYRGEKIATHLLRDGHVFQIGLVYVTFRAGNPAGADAKKEAPAAPALPTKAATAQATAPGVQYEGARGAERRIDDFPFAMPITANLDTLDVTGGLRPGRF